MKIKRGQNHFKGDIFSTVVVADLKLFMSCSPRDIIYTIQCCRSKVHYIGETKRHLIRDRFGEHRRAIEKAINQHIDQPTAVSDHFTLPGHSIQDIKLSPLELVYSNRDGTVKPENHF